MRDQDYEKYAECIGRAKAEKNKAKTIYDAEVKAARKAFLQKNSNQTDYYNSDDEDENLIDSAIPPNFFTNHIPQYQVSNIAENNKYLERQQKPILKCEPVSIKPIETPTYNYSQQICNLKYIRPTPKVKFSLAYRKPISKVYVYNNYIQTQKDLPKNIKGYYKL